MKILLILNKTQSKELRVVVRLHKKTLQERVEELIRAHRGKEAFDLILAHAQVETYLPPGLIPEEKPDLTFIEDMV